MNVKTSWWDGFFEGLSVDLWLAAIPPAQSEQEADGLIAAMGLATGGRVLDVPCGAGRLSLAIARRGFEVTGVDWSPEFLAHARASDPERRVTWDQRDMRDLPWAGRFDAAFCVGNSFGYLEDEGNAAFLRAVAGALKPDGRFVLETPMTHEGLLPHLQPRPWWKVGDIYLLVVNTYDPVRSRLDIEYTFSAPGRTEIRHGSHRVYSLRELLALFDTCGFTTEIDRSSWPDGRVPQNLRVVARPRQGA